MRRTPTPIKALGMVLLLAVVGGACSSSDDSAPTSGADRSTTTTATSESSDEGNAVEIERFEYRPETIEVSVGEEVTWTNGDKIIHWVTAGTPDAPTGEFMEPMPEEGTSVTLTFDEVGEFQYFCTRHEFMQGTVVVTE